MKKLINLIVFIASLNFTAWSQEKQMTLDDAVYGFYRTIYMNNLQNIQWRNNQTFTYVKGANLYQQSIEKSTETIAINGNDLFTLTKDSAFNSFFVFPDYEWTNDNIIWIKHSPYFAELDIKNKKVLAKITCPDTAENFDLHISKKMVAFTIQNNLWIATADNKTICIASDNNKGIVYGKSVHRNEFGIEKGTFWSHTGKYLAFYRMDESMVTEYPLVDINTRIASTTPIRYPMAGMKSHEVTIGIYNTETNKTVYLKTGEPKEQYLTNISWSLNDAYILVAILNREQNHLQLNMYNPETGEYIKTLFEEKNERYVEPLHPAEFITENQFIWQSQRDGFNHLYLYSTDGKLIKQLTRGNWVVTQWLGIDPNKQWIYIQAAYPTALERRILKVSVSNEEIVDISQTAGTHEPYFNKDFSRWIDAYQNTSTPLKYYLMNNEGKLQRTIYETPNVLKDYKLGKLEMVTIKAADGVTDLFGRIVKPSDFDSTKKYPLILYVYGGPHAQMVQNKWLGGASFWDYYMAQKGYIVATIDNRGSANRGFDFESCIHRQLGNNEAKDQMEFVNYLLSKGYIDKNRIGVHGWSYGGFMTLTLMTNYPDIFKVGVSGGPVIDWKYYEIMYGERYMDTPQQNPEGYEKSSLLNKAKQLKGKALIIHGYMDDTVVLQHSLVFIEQCIKFGIPVDFFLYPTHAHNVRGKDRIHLMKKVSQYFDDYLK